jgi:uncharacterized protein (TIGR03083 family)
MADRRQLLGESIDRLRRVVEGRDPGEPSYCDDWTVAQVLSHLGSGAVIGMARLEGGEVDPEPVWAEWNAKSPEAMVADGLAADAAFLARLEAPVTEPIRLGPMELGVDEFVGFRVNEHVVHTWDVEVTGDPTAALQPSAVPGLLDFLPTMAPWAGKPVGPPRDVVVTTAFPDRISLGDEQVTITDTDAPADLTLPAEALVRLVYGRLDDAPDELRRAFPGV